MPLTSSAPQTIDPLSTEKSIPLGLRIVLGREPQCDASLTICQRAVKTSHFEERIALSVVPTAQRRDESTQRELAAFNNDFGGGPCDPAGGLRMNWASTASRTDDIYAWRIQNRPKCSPARDLTRRQNQPFRSPGVWRPVGKVCGWRGSRSWRRCRQAGQRSGSVARIAASAPESRPDCIAWPGGERRVPIHLEPESVQTPTRYSAPTTRTPPPPHPSQARQTDRTQAADGR